MNEVEENDVHPDFSYFMPYHPVLKPDSSTTKLRIVFDASCRSTSNKSLNDILMVGPTVQDELLNIVLRFRMHRFVLTADIEKMFRQIVMNHKHRKLQLIVHRFNPSDPVKIYQMNTVTYGTASAAYTSTRVLKHLAETEAINFPLASAALLNDCYMDDIQTGCDDYEQALELRSQLSALLKKGAFNLRKWSSNCPDLLSGVPEHDREPAHSYKFDKSDIIKTLGLQWDRTTDKLMYNFAFNDIQSKPLTKRIVLSELASLFDPLGLISPVIAFGKIFLQTIWKRKYEWDSVLDNDLVNIWLAFRQQIPIINDIEIPRLIKSATDDIVNIQIHGFSDASEKAYGACIYIRTTNNQNQSSSYLLISKSKIAPIKAITIPRLELNAAVLLGQLYAKTVQAISHLKLSFETYFWTDSSITFYWIKSTDTSKWNRYVENRVNTIQSLTNIDSWNHIAGVQNPADHISRGLLPNDIQCDNNLWWHGPEWLTLAEHHWPKTNVNLVEYSTHENEERKTKKKETEALVLVSSVNESPILILIDRLSSYNKIIRIVALCRRFIYISLKGQPITTQTISVLERKEATQCIIKVIQRTNFSTELNMLLKNKYITKGKLKNLSPFLDSDGIIRVGGRLKYADLSYDQRHPILLPDKTRFTSLLIQHFHLSVMHAGPQLLLSTIRQQYWPINGRNQARLCVFKCVQCFRVKPRSSDQIMADLPESRINPAPPFSTTGVDYCGPFHLKPIHRRAAAQKVYLCIFVCFATKAAHLEIAGDLSTPTFIAALKRFVSRRGRPSHIHSDNGTNFLGASRDLEFHRQLFSEEKHHQLCTAAAEMNIQWHFTPPNSPHFGGLWESCVKSAKYHLMRVLKDLKPTREEFETVTAQVEACLNSRPLTQQYDHPNDPQPLTPGHFLIGRPLNAIPDPDFTDIPQNRLSKWQQMQQALQHFWRRWTSEYLQKLQERTKWQIERDNIKSGAIVLMKSANYPPQQWPLAKVIELSHGKDGKVRVVKLQTAGGIYSRNITKICVLPIDDNEIN